MTAAALLAEVTRRDVRSGYEVVESVHTGHLVVTGDDGTVLASLGAPDRPIFVRSAAKPFQAAACLEVIDGPPPAPDELAVAWSSHRGEDRHLVAVRALLARSGTAPDELTCPPAVAEARPGDRPSRLQHNCSGKHALFALAAHHLGCPRSDLLQPEGPLQTHVLARLQERFGPVAALGIDGCGAPAVAVTLTGLSRAFARLAVDADLAPVRDAGLTHPALVGGRGRLESALLGAGVVAKVGAEGVYGVGWVSPDGAPFGLAVKGADGNSRGPAAAIIGLLEAAKVVPEGTWSPPPPLGGGRPAGVVRAATAVLELAPRLGMA